jgi:hypothetical protein
MTKTYKLVFNSASGSGNTQSKTYNFDWNLLDDGYYEVSFTFNSNSGVLNSANIPMIYIDIGQDDTYIIGSGSFGNFRFLGTVFNELINTAPMTSYFYAHASSNAPLIIKRPNSNQITININNTSNTGYTTDGSVLLPDYILILNLKQIHND